MADTGAAVSVGDAILRFLGDTTQLDAAFNKVATEAGEKLGVVASGGVKQLDAAVTQATASVDGMTGTMAVGQQGAVLHLNRRHAVPPHNRRRHILTATCGGPGDR